MRGVVAALAVLGACFAAAVAYAANGILSTGESNSHQTPLLVAQLIVAVVGLLRASLFARALVRRRDLQALIWLVISLFVYLGWAVLNDAAVHGWAGLKVF